MAALPSLAGRELRMLGGDLVAGAAADTALLATRSACPFTTPFPGTPAWPRELVARATTSSRRERLAAAALAVPRPARERGRAALGHRRA